MDLPLELVRLGGHQCFLYLILKRRVDFGVRMLCIVVCASLFSYDFHLLDLLGYIIFILFLFLYCNGIYYCSDFNDLESANNGKMGVLNYTQAGNACLLQMFLQTFPRDLVTLTDFGHVFEAFLLPWTITLFFN